MSYERVLLPVSGKHSGERALKALSQARKLDPKEIILLHAVAPSVGSPMPNIMRDQQDIAVKAEALLAPLAAELDNAGISYQTVIRHGLPVETIVKAAKEMDAEAIVMFSDGREDCSVPSPSMCCATPRCPCWSSVSRPCRAIVIKKPVPRNGLFLMTASRPRQACTNRPVVRQCLVEMPSGAMPSQSKEPT